MLRLHQDHDSHSDMGVAAVLSPFYSPGGNPFLTEI